MPTNAVRYYSYRITLFVKYGFHQTPRISAVKLLRSEVMKKRIEKFAETSTFHGFIEMFHAKSLIWTVFWAIMVLAAFSVTSVQLYNAISQYLDQNSDTVIAPALESQLYDPPLRLCYVHWIYWVDWKKAFSMNFTKESILFGLSYITRGFSSSFFNVTKAKEDFVKQLSVNNISTLSQFYEAIAKMEQKIKDIKTIQFYSDKFDFTYRDPNIVFCYSISSESIYKILHNQVIANKLDGRKLAFSIPDQTYSNVRDYLTEDEYNHHLIWWLAKNSNYYVDSVDQFNKNVTDNALPILLYPDGYSTQSVQLLHDNDAYTVNLRASAHQWKNSDDSVCNPNDRSIITDSTCQDICLAKQNMVTCSCPYIEKASLCGEDMVENLCPEAIYFLPLSDSNFRPQKINFLDKSTTTMNDVMNETYQADFKIGRNFFDNDYPPCSNETNVFNVSECLDQCVPSCELWNYEMSVSVTSMPKFGHKVSFKNRTDIIIKYPTVGDVLIMTEIDPQTWENFVGNIGGLLGIWTGASILSFIQMIYLCCFYDGDETAGCGTFTRIEEKK